jgi:eukaryotic-like serine/threonine-protein kinase
MVLCPSCGNSNLDGSSVCGQCGSDVSFETVVDPDLPSRPRNASRLARNGADSGPLSVGDVVCDRYTVLQLLGRGGMGCVYKVMDRHVGRVIALKAIHSHAASDQAAISRFKDEMLLARQVTHKNVIRIFDFGVDGDLRFITMEYCEGEDLCTRLKRTGRMPAAQAIPIMRQICAALVSAHAEGVLHRDLKPQNILINQRDEIRILDFGLARAYEGEAGMSGVLAGTPDYMSPEQAKSERLDARSDLFSAGVVFYEMLTGSLPFKGDTMMARLLARTQEHVRPVSIQFPDIPLGLSAIVGRCLERDRKRRYASAQEILNDLQLIEAGARDKAFIRLLPHWKLSAVFAGVALLLVIAGLLVWRHGSQRASVALTSRYVAVLPFSNSLSESAVKPAADGIRESISSLLSAMKSIHSVASTAVDRADLSKPGDDIARQVGANILLSGHVVQQAGELHVALALYDVWKHQEVWSKEFAGARSDLLALEDQVGGAVLAALQLQPAAEGAVPVEPTRNMEAYDLYLQGREALKNKRDDAAEAEHALTYFEQAASKDNTFALAWSGVADASVNLYRLRHDPVDAQRALDAARRASQNSNLPEVHLAAGSVYTQTGRHDEAIAEIRRALTLAPNSDDAYVRLGRAYLEAGRASEALDALQAAVRMNPYYWFNHEQLGRAFFRVGRDDDALREFHKFSELAPDSASAHLGIAGVLVRKGEWEKSIPEYQKSLALKPSGTGYTSLGTVLFYLGRYAEALPNFQKAAQMDPRNPLALGNLGSAYRQLGQKEKAAEVFSRAIAAGYQRLELNPRDAMMLGSVALFHAYKGQPEEAFALIAKARSIDAASNELMYNEAVINALANPVRVEAAVAALRGAIANGYSADEAKRDPDLKVLAADPGFRALFSTASN